MPLSFTLGPTIVPPSAHAPCLPLTLRPVALARSEIKGNKVGACVLEESSLVLRHTDLATNADGPLFMSECSAPLVVVDKAPPPPGCEPNCGDGV